MLNHQNTYRGCWRSQRHSQPGWRWRSHEFDFSLRGKLVEGFLGNQHGAPGAIHVGSTTPSNLLGRRRDVKLVYEEGEMEHFRRRLVQGHETIFSVEDFLQCDVNQLKQIVEV